MPEEPLHTRQCAPKVAWVRVTHRAGGAQGCSPELWCSSGPPSLGELSLLQSSGTMCLARSSSPQTFGVSFVLLQPPRVLLLPFFLRESITP